MTRWFHGPDCETVDHEPGERHWAIGCEDMEWTGKVWTLVCPGCDKPMSGRTNGTHGYLCCTGCALNFSEVPRRTEPPAAV